MILSDGAEKLLYISHPRKRTSFLKVIFFRIMGECFQLKWIVTVSNVMALSIHSSYQIEERITQPVENEKHLNLLPEVYLLMSDKLGFIVRLACDPDEYEKR